MSRPRGTQASLTLSGLKDKRPGYYNQRSWVTGTVIPADAKLTCPSHYCKETKKAWKAMTSNLISMGALSEQDLPMLGALFDSYDRYNQVKLKLEEFDAQENADWFSPEWLKTRRSLQTQLHAELANFTTMASRFGCTPTERSKLVCEKKEIKNEDPLEVLLEGGD